MSVAGDADLSVVIIASDGSYVPSGAGLTGPVTSVDKLESLIVWAREKRGLLQGRCPRVWVVGAAVRQLAGDDVNVGIDELVGRALSGLVTRGWELSGGGGRFLLARGGSDSDRLSVEVVIEEQPWLAAGDETVSEDAGELGLRLRRWTDAVGVLPDCSPARSGAVVFEAIEAAKSSRAARSAGGGALPGGIEVAPAGQPGWLNGWPVVEKAFEQAEELVWLEQLHPGLASAGMLSLGTGEPTVLEGRTAAAAAVADKRPFGLWLATLPAAGELSLPAALPLPHPAMHHDHAVAVWLTNEDLTGLAAAVRDGGAGLPAGALDIGAAVIWPQQGRLLEGWATRFRAALADPAHRSDPFVAAAGEYLAALGDPDAWPGRWERHYQPAWAAAIAAHGRFRGRRAAMRISREYKLCPLYCRDGGMLYAVGLDEDTGAVVDLADTHTRLGRLVVAARTTITDELIVEVFSAETDQQVAAALTGALHVPAAQADRRAASDAVPTAAADADTAAPQSESTAGPAGRRTVTPAEPRDGGGTAVAGPGRPAGGRRAAQRKVEVGGIVAGVLHTDGLWLPDGRCVEHSDPIVHVGQVAQLAWQHGIGYRLSAKYAEPGQVWLTEDFCATVGIDAAAISRRDPNTSLRQLTAGLDFVTVAAAQGWGFGGGQNEKAELGTWTRVYRPDTDLKGPLVAVIPGMTRKQGEDIAILEDADPARIARRLQMFADSLGYPWKINAGVTAVDLMLQCRPKTRSPEEWRSVVFAPSRTKEPFGMSDIESDFEWSRTPTEAEAAMTYVHAYDRGASYPAAISGLELPIGDPVHHPEGMDFDPSLPGYWQIEVPEAQEWLLPYLLNPRGRRFSGPKWVCTPRLERAIALGYAPTILEAYVWPQHGRVLRGWYERFHKVAAAMDIDGDPDAQAVRSQAKVVRTNGIGLMGSLQHLQGKTGYSPERRYHIVSKASASIIYKLHQIGVDSGRWPLALITDTVLYASDDPDPVSAWPGDPKTLGRGFGQYKPEASGLLAQHREFFTGRNYRGKQALTPAAQWHAEMLTDTGTVDEAVVG